MLFRSTDLQFDDLGRVIEERSSARGLRQTFHDALDRPVKQALADGTFELRRFDAAGRLIAREEGVQAHAARMQTAAEGHDANDAGSRRLTTISAPPVATTANNTKGRIVPGGKSTAMAP